MTSLSKPQIHSFQETVWAYFAAHPRDMPWRSDPSPYHVLVSELMLQQTQVSRVLPKYKAFLQQFPTAASLAEAPLAAVLVAWNGLGYNRRAKFLQAAAIKIVHDFDGQVPSTMSDLVSLPGVGKNTAGAILAYAFNQPVVFVETNIRTVFFHHFFADRDDIDDKEVQLLVEQTVDREHPREWYWALMDYGAHLKSTAGGRNAHSRQYTRQSKFEGSHRQLRGEVVRRLVNGADVQDLQDERLPLVIDELLREGFIERVDGQLRLHQTP